MIIQQRRLEAIRLLLVTAIILIVGSTLVRADTIIKNANGSSVTTKSDGTKIIINADGSSVTDLPGGTEIVKNADGSSGQDNPDGSKIIIDANGHKTLVP